MRIVLLATLLGAIAGGAAAFPDDVPWDAGGPQGCARCHFDEPAIVGSDALAMEGLPQSVVAGEAYRLTVRLAVPGMARAGFLATATAGAFAALDGGSEASAAGIRSTLAGSEAVEHGSAEWSMGWTAPVDLDGPVSIAVWANAADDDGSPFGDVIHRRTWTIPAP